MNKKYNRSADGRFAKKNTYILRSIPELDIPKLPTSEVPDTISFFARLSNKETLRSYYLSKGMDTEKVNHLLAVSSSKLIYAQLVKYGFTPKK